MPASPAESAIYSPLFGDPETVGLFTDAAELGALIRVEGALAQVQGALGVIPSASGAFLYQACDGVQIDPATLAGETAANGVPIPALLTALRQAIGVPEHTQYLHWGATSQDIMDTALALRLRRVLDLWEQRLTALLAALAALAESHADLPMAARTFGQIATPTTFGAMAASWGWPLLAHQGGLQAARRAVLRVSLSGAAGTLSAMGPLGPRVRAELATELGLADPGHGWHADRSGIAQLAGWMAGLAGTLGKLGEDLILLSQSGIAEVRIAGSGASSTMPQKQNPVGPSVLVAVARQVIGLAAILQGAALHRQNRDGAAWFTEWLTLPQICISSGRALSLACDLVARITPDADAMAKGLAEGGGLIHAEALTFALANRMPRPDAQAVVKRLCSEVAATGTALADIAAQVFPDLDWAKVLAQHGTGHAPDEARAFVTAVAGAITETGRQP